MTKPDGQHSLGSAPESVVFPGARTSPRLLVSVRSADEAHEAIAGGAEILDVKEPARGSLGMASMEAIEAISTIPVVLARQIPMSVALGELVEWNNLASIPRLPAGSSLAKLGLSRCGGRADWITDWVRVRQEFERNAGIPIDWVAVAYADFAEAAAPQIDEIVAAAIKTECAGLLIDTWTKDARMLLDELHAAELSRVASRCHEAGLFLALAGRLNRGALKSLSGIPADIVAIRSAACRNHDRISAVHADCVAEFKTELKLQFL